MRYRPATHVALSLAMGLALTIMMAACAPIHRRCGANPRSGHLAHRHRPNLPAFRSRRRRDTVWYRRRSGPGAGRRTRTGIQFTYLGYDGLYDALTTGQVDVLISALVIAPRTKVATQHLL